MSNKKEENILRLIKFVPVFSMMFLVFGITYFVVLNESDFHNENKKELKKLYIEKSKQKVKNEIYGIFDYIEYRTKNAEIFLKKDLKKRIDEVYKVMAFIYNKYKKTHTKEQIVEKIKDFLHSYSFNDGRGYFYMYYLDGTNILLPSNKSIEGTNILKNPLPYIHETANKVLLSLKGKNEAFCKIKWTKPNDKKTVYEKITYNRIFKPYDIIIGTGEYIENYENRLKKEILLYLNKHKHSKNKYIFIYDYNGKTLSHFYKKFVNKNRWDFKNKVGVFLIQDVVNLAKKEKEGFLTYIASFKPETKKPSLKTSFIKGFDKWQWAIGTGFYHDDVSQNIKEIEEYSEKQKKKDIINILIFSGIITVFVLVFSLYISNLLKRMFLEHKEELLKHTQEARKKDFILAQQSKMVAIGEMIQNISHQWRQPLSAVSSISSGLKLKKEYKILQDKEFDEGMEKIIFYTQYLSQTIDDFRNYFASNEELKSFNLKATIDKCIKLLEVQLNKNNIKIINNVEDFSVISRENMLIQVFLNFISNAKDEFIKKENKDRFIFIGLEERKENFSILVKDNAGGIASENLDKIFSMYFSTKTNKEGSGIGLYMVREIVEGLNGEIKARNEEFIYEGKNYKGAVFEIILPLSKK